MHAERGGRHIHARLFGGPVVMPVRQHPVIHQHEQPRPGSHAPGERRERRERLLGEPLQGALHTRYQGETRAHYRPERIRYSERGAVFQTLVAYRPRGGDSAAGRCRVGGGSAIPAVPI